jgi:hypothetical protein
VSYPEVKGGRNLRVGGGGRSVDKGRVGEVEILSGGWIGIGGLVISLYIADHGRKLTELESFT